jgi:predicted nucleic acid-binding protein
VIVLDASVLIAYLDANDAHHQTAEAMLAREIDDDFAINPLTLAEVLVAPARDHRLDDVMAVLESLDIRELPFPAEGAVALATLRVATKLKMPDCCVLLSAEHAGARLASFDVRLSTVAAARNLTVLTR